jgi:hypothetical protein
MVKYDYVIVGAGPTGLTIAWLLTKYNKKILLIDREKDIGGCHRVRRVNGYFTEHGPRIYTSSYEMLKVLMNDLKLPFDSLFTDYNFSIGDVKLSTLSPLEFLWLSIAYFRYMLFPNYSKSISCLGFMKLHNFKKESIQFIDQLCRLTDGGGANRYTLYELFKLFDQSLNKIVQPNKPLDTTLFKKWKDALLKTDNITIMLQTDVVKIISNGTKIVELKVKNNLNGEFFVSGDNFVMAVPPLNLIKLLENSASAQVQNAFGELSMVKEWADDTRYEPYIPVIFHWDTKINLKKKWGSTATSWGLVYVALSDYMNFDNKNSKTVISTCYTLLDKKSPKNKKTLNESSRDEILKESFRQLKTIYPKLPEPTKSILSPGVTWDETTNSFVNKDHSYLTTKNLVSYKNKSFSGSGRSESFNNLFSIGTHNENSNFGMTSMETAIISGFKYCYGQVEGLEKKMPIKEKWVVQDVVKLIIMILLIILFMYLW